MNQANYSIVWTSIASGLPTAVDATNRAIDLPGRRLPRHGYGQYSALMPAARRFRTSSSPPHGIPSSSPLRPPT
ncbi:MAG: hypothetical protein U5K79_23210 [Cyclobacteriaceae bacterium]|nr:hypothetical protein [Cyclobacteriaceae bacterium]